ncbi:hypothetical protein MD484_g7592, partial [Candolleomyces efflorescens]
MADSSPHSSFFSGASHFSIDNQVINSIAGNLNHYQVVNIRGDLNTRLNPILDASHTRNRKTSPPDSECFPGTREGVTQEITFWADNVDSMCAPEIVESEHGSTAMVHGPIPPVYWLHGFGGCGKSAISLKIAQIYSGSGRLLASYFFSRGAGDRSTMCRFAVTLASQLAAALPATVPIIEGAVQAEPGLLTDSVSLATQLERLILSPFRTVINAGALGQSLAQGPFLIVIDGLDECEDKRGVEEFIDHILTFFEEHPTIPLRVFITSRIEKHIRERLETDGVRMGNLNSHSAHKDIEKYLNASFQVAAKRDRVIRAYIRAHGQWPNRPDMNKLIDHIGGSFVLASTIFKYIVHPETEDDPLTPMDRLPLAFEMNGLDGLYAQTLARSQHLSHFREILSAITLLCYPLRIVEISHLLKIDAFKVVRVLLNLQAIVHVPGTDEEGRVTLCHTSLRDFLTTPSRSGSFFVSPSFHLHLSYYSFSAYLEQDGSDYGRWWFTVHWRSFACLDSGEVSKELELFDSASQPSRGDVDRNTFLCSIFFYSLLNPRDRLSRDDTRVESSLIAQCTKHLALAAECPGARIRPWLEKELKYPLQSVFQVPSVRLTEHTCKVMREDLQRASAAIQAKFPTILNGQPISSRTEEGEGFVAIPARSMSGIMILKALEWVVARAYFKWEELKMPSPRPPLELCIQPNPFDKTVRFSLSLVVL